jgi:hypothetical protein
MTRRRFLATMFCIAALTAHAQPPAENPAKFSAWSEPANLGPLINSEYSDATPWVSPDALRLYFASTRPVGGFGDFDIYVSQRKSVNDPWGKPQNLGEAINTAYTDATPSITPDGHWLYFISNRPGFCGLADIFVSYREDTEDDFAWGAPSNLGCVINTERPEWGTNYFEDPETGAITLYFTSSNRPEGIGGWDIYMSSLDKDGSFGPGFLVRELSGSDDDFLTSIRHDGLEMFVESTRPGGSGGRDLWVSTRSSTSEKWSDPINLGGIVNSEANDGDPSLSFDGTTLYFFSDRPGGSGDRDLYVTTRKKVADSGSK